MERKYFSIQNFPQRGWGCWCFLCNIYFFNLTCCSAQWIGVQMSQSSCPGVTFVPSGQDAGIKTHLEHQLGKLSNAFCACSPGSAAGHDAVGGKWEIGRGWFYSTTYFLTNSENTPIPCLDPTWLIQVGEVACVWLSNRDGGRWIRAIAGDL